MLSTALIIALSVLCLNACSREGMILSFIPKWLHFLPAWVKKPLYDCPVCMSFWWGIAIVLVTGTHLSPAKLFIMLLCACGYNVVFTAIIGLAEYVAELIADGKES